MRPLRFNAWTAILWGGLVAGVLDIAAVFAFWIVKGVSPVVILHSIASSVLGPAAYEGGAAAALLGSALHFAVSFAFVAAYVVVSARVRVLRTRPLLFGPAYGVVAYVIMTFVVVPLSLLDTRPWPPPMLNLAASVFIHLFLFGLPIAWAASRICASAPGGEPA